MKRTLMHRQAIRSAVASLLLPIVGSCVPPQIPAAATTLQQNTRVETGATDVRMEDSLRGRLVYRILKGSLILEHGTSSVKLNGLAVTVSEPDDFDNTYLVRKEVAKGSVPASIAQVFSQELRLLRPSGSTCALKLGKLAAYGWAVPPEGVELDTRDWVALSVSKRAQKVFREGAQFLAAEIHGDTCGSSTWAAPILTGAPELQFRKAQEETSPDIEIALKGVRGSPTYDEHQRAFETLKANVLLLAQKAPTKALPASWLDLEGTNRFWLVGLDESATLLVGRFERSTSADQLPPRTGDDPRFWFNPRLVAIWKIDRDSTAPLMFLGPDEPILKDGEQFSLDGSVSAFEGMPLLLFDTEDKYGALRFSNGKYVLDREVTFGPAQIQAPPSSAQPQSTTSQK